LLFKIKHGYLHKLCCGAPIVAYITPNIHRVNPNTIQKVQQYNKNPSREDVLECQRCLNVCLIFATAPLFLNLVIHFICVTGLWTVLLC
jgi:hypothetical protein